MTQQSFILTQLSPEVEKEICILVEHRVLEELYNVTQRHDADVERLENQIKIQNKVLKNFSQRIKNLEKLLT